MDPGREFLLERGYAPKLRAKIAKGRRAVMPGVTAMDDSAGVMSPLKQIIHDAAQQAGAGRQDSLFK